MQELNTTFDIILLLTSCTAVLYGIRVSQRLAALHGTRNGLAEAVVALTRSIKAAEEARTSIAEEAKSAVTALQEEVGKCEQKRLDAQDQSEALDGQLGEVETRIETLLKRGERLAGTLNTLNERSVVDVKTLTRAIEIAGKVNELTREQTLRSVRKRRRASAANAAVRESGVHTHPAIAEGVRGSAPPSNPFASADYELTERVRASGGA